MCPDHRSLLSDENTDIMSCYSAVRYQMQLHKNDLKPGDVLMTNSPHAGGSYVLSCILLYNLDLTVQLVISRILPLLVRSSTMDRMRSYSLQLLVDIMPTSAGFYQDLCHQRQLASSKRVPTSSVLRSSRRECLTTTVLWSTWSTSLRSTQEAQAVETFEMWRAI